ncbi:MAG: hypothetical protein HKL95_07460 [Phycisphaerae bacterium]|nr:hypothetical protein [Phycisphaerae bacterium]
MKRNNLTFTLGALMLALGTMMAACQTVQRVNIPSAQDRAAYQPVPYSKPLPPDAFAQTGGIGQHVPLPDEARYVRAYRTQRDPRMMVLVTYPTSKLAMQKTGILPNDYQAIQISMIDYLNAGGQVDIQDPQMAQQVLDRESFLRLQNGDPRVLPLIQHQLNTDILVEVQAAPTNQAAAGPAIRLLAQALGTTNGRVLGAEYVDMPLPMSKTNINLYTGFLADKLMQKLTTIWSGGAGAFNPVTVRIYNAATVDDVLKIQHFVEKVPGVGLVVEQGITGSSATAYGTLAVQYKGSPAGFYVALKRELGVSSGLKATDIQNNTVDMEITGPMILKTTSITTKTRVRTETQTVTKTIENNPIQPAR